MTDNTANGNYDSGIHVEDSYYCTLTGNDACYTEDEYGGIYIDTSDNCTLTGNNASYSEDFAGIRLEYSNNTILTNNTFSYNYESGFEMYYCFNTTMSNNTASHNDWGIWIQDSQGSTLTNNIMSLNDYNFGVWAGNLEDYYNDIDASNLVDSKPIYYWINISDSTFPDDAGTVYAINCSNVTVEDIDFVNNEYGVLFAYTSNSTIDGITASDCEYGYYLYYSDNNTLMNNDVSGNDYGIYFDSSDNNALTGDTASNNTDTGLYLDKSLNNVLTDSTFNRNDEYGIYLYYSDNCNLTGNTANNNVYGISARTSENCTFMENIASNNAVSLIPDEISMDEISINGLGVSGVGYYLYDCPATSFIDNQADNNTYYDLYLSSSENSSVNPLILGDDLAEIDFTSNSSTVEILRTETNVNEFADKTNVNGYISIVSALDSMNMSLFYSDSGMTSSKEATLALYKLNGTEWDELNATVDTSSNTVTVNLTEFGTFALFKDSDTAATTTTTTRSSSGTRASVSQSQNPEIVSQSASLVKRITAGSEMNYDFSDSGTPVLGVSFDAKDDKGLVVAKVQVLSSNPEGVPSPSGRSYQMMSIDVGSEGTISSSSGSADNIQIRFKVSKQWIEENNIDVSTIRMTRYNDGQWGDLPTYQEREEGEYIHFYAETPGFSVFNVVGDEMGETLEQVQTSSPVTGEVEEPVEEEETPDTPGFTALAGVVFVSLVVLTRKK